MTTQDRLRWDARYENQGAPPEAVALPEPFAAHEHEFPATGQALELACGAGVFSVWLARRGLHVWGVDVSPVAIAHARDLAARNGVGEICRFDVVDLDGGLPAGPPVDVFVCHRFRDPRLDRAIIERLAPGALLAVSALSEVGAQPGRFRAKPGELTAAFAQLETIASGEGDGEAWLLARK
ncbi:class I SAM-dependent methyltransferase [[Mycobacterium] wendilense]|uniref:Class I SAM-dependent methyltransferase n=1 Tax=[Mycobacterium] wendilense TaxID=3064284 RepID=A0ABN9P406_9MYCO|nr:class I SAM-dependent methyltransferase [Mycolicibacterium sp. MU0050]CAJ1581913.1 class I SAM-dependent methyltransferase [Mycolicibacterium sp. MU0050]